MLGRVFKNCIEGLQSSLCAAAHLKMRCSSSGSFLLMACMRGAGSPLSRGRFWRAASMNSCMASLSSLYTFCTFVDPQEAVQEFKASVHLAQKQRLLLRVAFTAAHRASGMAFRLKRSEVSPVDSQESHQVLCALPAASWPARALQQYWPPAAAVAVEMPEQKRAA